MYRCDVCGATDPKRHEPRCEELRKLAGRLDEIEKRLNCPDCGEPLETISHRHMPAHSPDTILPEHAHRVETPDLPDEAPEGQFDGDAFTEPPDIEPSLSVGTDEIVVVGDTDQHPDTIAGPVETPDDHAVLNSEHWTDQPDARQPQICPTCDRPHGVQLDAQQDACPVCGLPEHEPYDTPHCTKQMREDHSKARLYDEADIEGATVLLDALKKRLAVAEPIAERAREIYDKQPGADDPRSDMYYILHGGDE